MHEYVDQPHIIMLGPPYNKIGSSMINRNYDGAASISCSPPIFILLIPHGIMGYASIFSLFVKIF